MPVLEARLRHGAVRRTAPFWAALVGQLQPEPLTWSLEVWAPAGGIATTEAPSTEIHVAAVVMIV